MRSIGIIAASIATFCLAACGSGSESGVGGVSASEASALNDAAAMLDARAGDAQAGDVGLNPAARAAAEADRGRAPTAAQDGPSPDDQP